MDGPRLTQREVVKFLRARGGRCTNFELVSAFRGALNAPRQQAQARTLFKDIVNTVANVGEYQNTKYIELKKEYWDTALDSDNPSPHPSSPPPGSGYTSPLAGQGFQPYWRYRLSTSTAVPPLPVRSAEAYQAPANRTFQRSVSESKLPNDHGDVRPPPRTRGRSAGGFGRSVSQSPSGGFSSALQQPYDRRSSYVGEEDASSRRSSLAGYSSLDHCHQYAASGQYHQHDKTGRTNWPPPISEGPNLGESGGSGLSHSRSFSGRHDCGLQSGPSNHVSDLRNFGTGNDWRVRDDLAARNDPWDFSLGDGQRDFSARNDLRDLDARHDCRGYSSRDGQGDFNARSDLRDIDARNDPTDFDARNDLRDLDARNDLRNLDARNDQGDFNARNDLRDLNARNDHGDFSARNNLRDLKSSNDPRDFIARNDLRELDAENDQEDFSARSDLRDLKPSNDQRDLNARNDLRDYSSVRRVERSPKRTGICSDDMLRELEKDTSTSPSDNAISRSINRLHGFSERPTDNHSCYSSLPETGSPLAKEPQAAIPSVDGASPPLLPSGSVSPHRSNSDYDTVSLCSSNSGNGSSNVSMRSGLSWKALSQDAESVGRGSSYSGGEDSGCPPVPPERRRRRPPENNAAKQDEQMDLKGKVKDRVQHFDGLQLQKQQSSVVKGVHKRGTSPLHGKENRSHKANLIDDDVSISALDPKLKKEWFVKAAQGDYYALVGLLKKEPRLAAIKDIATGFTALHWAAKHGDANIVKLIAGTYGVNPNMRSNGGYTAIHLATMYKHLIVVDLLIHTYGADASLRDYSGKRADQYPANYVRHAVAHKTVERRPLKGRSSGAKESGVAAFMRIGSLNLRKSARKSAVFASVRGRTWGPMSGEARLNNHKSTRKKNSKTNQSDKKGNQEVKNDSDSDNAYGFYK